MGSPYRGARPAPEPRRAAALDGLRGLAALVVVVYHAMLVSPAFADVIRNGTASGGVRWAAFSPLHLLWAGSEAVVVFFVLSGYVLTLPFLRATGAPTWRSYYGARLVRLYVPVAASLAVAVALFVLVDHSRRPGRSWWIDGHDLTPTVGSVLDDLLLVTGPSWLNSPLWSLQWEVIFSGLLPLAALVAVRARGLRPWLAVGCFAVIVLVGVVHLAAARYLVMFGVGVLMAAERERLAAWTTRWRPAVWACVVTAAALLVLAGWWPVIGRSPWAPALTTLGAALLVAAFLWCGAAVRVGESGPVQWLGRRSFSLYLVHEPIVVVTALLLDTTNPVETLAVALPTSLAVTAVFFVIVERPSHRLARRVFRAGERPKVATDG